MPGRKIPLIDNQIYHVLNRGITSQPVFLNHKDYQRATETLFYYQNQKPNLKYSSFLKQSVDQRNQILEKLRKLENFLVEVIAYCLMPNHFHLLLRQLKENGISIFMSNFENSYARYFNTKTKRKGHLFEGKFKAVRIETDEQLLHVSRYIHLNPYSSYLIKSFKDLFSYPYSSLSEYLNPQKEDFCQKEIILSNFKRFSYKKFLTDQADHQRKLQEIKYLILED